MYSPSSVVDLPQPDGPNKHVICPGSTLNETASTTLVLSYILVSDLISKRGTKVLGKKTTSVKLIHKNKMDLTGMELTCNLVQS